MAYLKRVFLVSLSFGAVLLLSPIGASAFDFGGLFGLPGPEPELQLFTGMVAPEFIEGNVTCGDLGDYVEKKIESPVDGVYFLDGTYEVTLDVYDEGRIFDWDSELGIDIVVVKGGDNANAYIYPFEAFSDTGLHAPINASGYYAGLSHISFCFDYELMVEKTAETSYTRTYTWNINKSVDPAEWTLFDGESGESEYTVDVEKTVTDSDFMVEGEIEIYNPSPEIAATITGISDEISGIGSATVDCGVSFPYELAAGDTLLCSYEMVLPDATTRTNSATVETSGDIGGGETTADVDFAEADVTEEGYPTINVYDDMAEVSWEFGDSGSRTYKHTFDCSDVEFSDSYGAYPYPNTATIEETEQSDSEQVDVYCYQLEVAKTAVTSYDREYEWTIEKTGLEEELPLKTGEEVSIDYTVNIDAKYEDSGFGVEGEITVTNPAPMVAEIHDVTDELGIDEVEVECGVGFPYMPAHGSLVCTYEADLDNADGMVNVATVEQNLYFYPFDLSPVLLEDKAEYSASADVTFGDPNTVTDECVTVDDDQYGPLGEFCWDEMPKTIEYSVLVGGYEVCGLYDVPNVASLETNDLGIILVDDWTVDVTVPCELDIEKWVVPSFDRIWNWTIDKSADETEIVLDDAQEYTVNYDVDLTAEPIDDNWAVGGLILVENTSGYDAEIVDVTDVISPDIPAEVTCFASENVPASIDEMDSIPTIEFPYILMDGDHIGCYYGADLPDHVDRTNTATVYMAEEPLEDNPLFEDRSTREDVDFDSVETVMSEYDQCVDVSDTLNLDLADESPVCANGARSFHFEYPITFDELEECTYYEYPNTASFITNDTRTEGFADWLVTIDVPCRGCTLTQGYWKTHSEYGPARYENDTWNDPEIGGPDASFFLSGQTYYEVLWTSPKGGNAYYILAHQYIAAELNILAGAYAPGSVENAMEDAEELLNEYSSAMMDDLKGKTAKSVRADFLRRASLLDDFNNGYVGPGHCDW